MEAGQNDSGVNHSNCPEFWPGVQKFKFFGKLMMVFQLLASKSFVLWDLMPSDKWHKRGIAKSSEIMKCLNFLTETLEIDYILSHKKQSCDLSSLNLWIQNGTTNLQNIIWHLSMYTSPFSKFSQVISSLPPFASSDPLPVVGSHLFVSIGSLRFSGWLSGSVDHLLCACSWQSGFRSMCCLLDLSAWYWFPGFPSWWSGVVLSLLGPH